MVDLTAYTVKDFYTNTVVKVRDEHELYDWLVEKTVTKTGEFYRQCTYLQVALREGTEHRWHAEALGLTITPKKQRRKRK